MKSVLFFVKAEENTAEIVLMIVIVIEVIHVIYEFI